MNVSTWYEVVAAAKSKGQGPDPLETASAGNLHGARTRVAELRAKHPDAHMIFVKRHQKGGKVIVLHDLTVHEGLTARERRGLDPAPAMLSQL